MGCDPGSAWSRKATRTPSTIRSSNLSSWSPETCSKRRLSSACLPASLDLKVAGYASADLRCGRRATLSSRGLRHQVRAYLGRDILCVHGDLVGEAGQIADPNRAGC